MSTNNLLAFTVIITLCVGALPASADSFFTFGVSSGHSHSFHDGFHDDFHHGPFRYRYWGHERFERENLERESWAHRSFYPPFYEPRPIIVYDRPSVIERRIIVEEPEVIQATRGRVISNNPYCREYQRNVTVGNRIQESYGTACRQPDGAWKIVDEPE